MAANSIDTMVGAIQKYLRAKLLEEKDFKTPLANSDYGVAGSIPQKNGQYIEYRIFNDIGLPSFVNEGQEPAAGQSITSNVYQQPIKEIADWMEITALLKATDRVNVTDKCYNAMKRALLRRMARCTQEAFLMSYKDNIYGLNFDNHAFPTIFANSRATYNDLLATDYITMTDLVRARMRLENSRVPNFDGYYICVIDPALRMQLEEDPTFFDVVKRHEAMVKKILIPGHIMDWKGIRFIEQTDPYRTAVGVANEFHARGSSPTMGATEVITTAHMFGNEAFGYLGLDGMQASGIKFKSQDISITGTSTTLGYRVSYNVGTLQRYNGINVRGALKYAEVNDAGATQWIGPTVNGLVVTPDVPADVVIR